MNFLYLYPAVFAAAFFVTLAAVPVCKRIAHAAGFLDVPASEAHKRHGHATPLLGGAAIAAGWFVTLGAGLAAAWPGGPWMAEHFPGLTEGIRASGRELAAVALCALAALALG